MCLELISEFNSIFIILLDALVYFFLTFPKDGSKDKPKFCFGVLFWHSIQSVTKLKSIDVLGGHFGDENSFDNEQDNFIERLITIFIIKIEKKKNQML